ncbi:unnamed protein product [Ilex paraguariensis]|uniref:Peptidase C1A papain C-terminal domain-containing protein n=1 Tax=Ilex paraguariensis TaxID=185542 RepID=A0ABC8UMW9_9AQUA
MNLQTRQMRSLRPLAMDTRCHPIQRQMKATSFKYENVTVVPASMDWRKKGAVTPIKDQGQCGKESSFINFTMCSYTFQIHELFFLTSAILSTGSCRAFSTIAATEGITLLTTGKLISLSEQELVDCDRSGEDEGCEGGYIEDGFKFIVKSKGIATEAIYPYQATDGTCNTKEEASHAAKIKGYENVPINSQKALLKAVANQPVSVSIDASGAAFQFYSSGVFTGDCGTDLDHGVMAVGYGTTADGTKYWLVKNSCGTTSGDKGYIMIQRDIGAKEGLCGIAMDSSYPIA